MSNAITQGPKSKSDQFTNIRMLDFRLSRSHFGCSVVSPLFVKLWRLGAVLVFLAALWGLTSGWTLRGVPSAEDLWITLEALCDAAAASAASLRPSHVYTPEALLQTSACVPADTQRSAIDSFCLCVSFTFVKTLLVLTGEAPPVDKWKQLPRIESVWYLDQCVTHARTSSRLVWRHWWQT